jgi:hypothetical protein
MNFYSIKIKSQNKRQRLYYLILIVLKPMQTQKKDKGDDLPGKSLSSEIENSP